MAEVAKSGDRQTSDATMAELVKQLSEQTSRLARHVSDTRDPDQIKEQIEATRAELGDTVEALAAKTDVKAQAQHRIEETKATITARTEEILVRAKELSPDAAVSAASGAGQKARENPLPVAAAGAFALGFLAGRFTKDP